MSEPKIQSLLESASERFADKTAVVFPDDGLTLTYRELAEKVEKTRHSLSEQGMRAGDVMVFAMPNGAEFLIAFLAQIALGAVALPVNPALTKEELRFAIVDSGAGFLLAQGRETERLETASASIDLEGVAMMLYTSGTTSKPKAVPLTQSNLSASVDNFSRWFRLTPDDATIVVMPPFHVHGLIGVTLSTLCSGGKAVIPHKFSASHFWPQVIEHGVTWYSASPTIHQILLKRADDDGAPRSCLRFIRSSSAKLPPAVRTQMEERFETVVLEAYGMTEAANQISANPLPPLGRKTGSVGLPAGTEIAILDDKNERAPTGQTGEVCVRGEALLKGYRNNPEANAKSFTNGWFRTGDQGYLDSDGYLFLCGRIKELIIRGGENISPLEVESVLLEHSCVSEAVCFSVPDEKYGEEIEAAIVPHGQADTEDILQFCRERLIEFKIPKRIHILHEFPRNALNKVKREAVAAMCRQPTEV